MDEPLILINALEVPGDEAWFEGLTLTHGSDGTTIIHGPVADQAALHDLVQKTRDLGLLLTSVNHVRPGHLSMPPIETR